MKRKILLSLASLSLLFSGLVGCNKPAEPSQSKPAEASSEKTPESKSSAPASKSSNPTSKSSAPSSDPKPVHNHEYGDATVTVKNADGKDVFVKECKDKDDKYIGIAFDDYFEKSADFGDASTYTNVPEEIRNESHLLAKSSSISWKINIDKEIKGAKIAFGAVCTSTGHADQTLSNKYQAKVNDGTLANWEFDSSATYGDVGLSPTARIYLVALTADLVAGENIITLSQGNGGYRLLFGGEVQVHYNTDALPVNAPVPAEGYDITFSGEHCKVYVYESGQDYSVDPVETNTTKSRDEEGNITKWIEPEEADTLEPQVNFKVVCDAGYEVDADCLAITGEYNKIKIAASDATENSWTIRVTKIKSDLAIVITPKLHQEDAVDGFEVTFALTNCTVKVYVGPKNETGSNVDTAEKYYSRSKTDPYDYTKSEGQINFEVVPNAGFKFDDGITWPETKPEVSSSAVSFITPSANYNKLKLNADGTYNLTKIAGALTITLTCVAA